MPRHLIAFAVTIATLLASVAGAQNAARLTRMADKLDAMDHAEFEVQIANASRCIDARSFACADTGLQAASHLVTDQGDQATLTRARTYLANERRVVEQEAQAAYERQAAANRVARLAEEERWRQEDADYNRQKQAMLAEQEASGAFSVGAQIQQELARNQQSQARINDIHNQTIANIEAAAAERRAREREARERDYAQQQRRSADAAKERVRIAQKARSALEENAAQFSRDQATREAHSAEQPRQEATALTRSSPTRSSTAGSAAAATGASVSGGRIFAYLSDPEKDFYIAGTEEEARAKLLYRQAHLADPGGMYPNVYDRGDGVSRKIHQISPIECRDTDVGGNHTGSNRYSCSYTVTYDVRSRSPKRSGPAVGITR